MTTQKDEAPELHPRDYVFCGVRVVNGRLQVCIRQLIDGELQPAWTIIKQRGFDRSIGGIYRGAQFSDNKVRDLGRAVYTGRWDVQSDLIEWEALDGAARVEDRARKQEGKAKQVGELEQLLLPVRAMYEGYRRRGDAAGMEVLRGAVLRALYRAPRLVEKENAR